MGLLIGIGVAAGAGIGVVIDNLPVGLMAGLIMSLVAAGLLIWWMNQEEE